MNILRPQRGQSLVETSIGLMLALVICLILYSLLAAPVGALIAETASQISIGLDYSHATMKHASAATAADECFQQHGVYERWWNEQTRRAAQICHVPDTGDWFVQIIQKINGQWEEITKFQKNKMTSYEQVAQYLRNCGYLPPQ